MLQTSQVIQKVNLQGLLENMAFGMCFWSSSVKYLGKAHLGRTVDGPENVKKYNFLKDATKCEGHSKYVIV